MSELAPVFNIIADDATKEGEPLISRTEGEVAAGKAGAIGFAYKDASGNVVLPSLTDAGRVPVDVEPRGIPYDDWGTETPAGLGSDTTVASITLTASKEYDVAFANMVSFQDTLWKFKITDDVTVTEIVIGGTGAGQYNHTMAPDCYEITAGASGTQTIELIAVQLRGPLSDVHGGFCLHEKITQ